MIMQHLPDFPPLPDCFSHLVSTDGEPRNLSSQFSHFSVASSLSRFSDRGELDHYIMNGRRSSLSNVTLHEDCGSFELNSLSASAQNDFTLQSDPRVENGANDVRPTDQKNPFLKLQTSLQKLQREMKHLRYLDISLFCQLLSLHEAVQEFKMTIADRYSETGSEYSLGTASYMGSMSSLNEDSDWGEDGGLLISAHEQQESSEVGENMDENCQSTSSLLKQITELALRADNDF